MLLQSFEGLLGPVSASTPGVAKYNCVPSMQLYLAPPVRMHARVNRQHASLALDMPSAHFYAPVGSLYLRWAFLRAYCANNQG